MVPATGTKTLPPAPTVGGAVIGPPTGADHNSEPVASSNAPSPGPLCVSTTSKSRPPATAGPMPDAETPAGAVHNGLHAWPPKNGTQFVWPAASNADTVLRPFANTLPSATTIGLADPAPVPSDATNVAEQKLRRVLQFFTPLTSKPTMIGAVPAIVTNTVLEAVSMAERAAGRRARRKRPGPHHAVRGRVEGGELPILRREDETTCGHRLSGRRNLADRRTHEASDLVWGQRRLIASARVARAPTPLDPVASRGDQQQDDENDA